MTRARVYVASLGLDCLLYSAQTNARTWGRRMQMLLRYGPSMEVAIGERREEERARERDLDVSLWDDEM